MHGDNKYFGCHQLIYGGPRDYFVKFVDCFVKLSVCGSNVCLTISNTSSAYLAAYLAARQGRQAIVDTETLCIMLSTMTIHTPCVTLTSQ